MRKVYVVALAVTGLLVGGPTALAAPEPSGNLPGYDTPQHSSGHDHGKKAHDHKKHDKGKKSSKHGHGHGHHHHGDGAHASGGYDSHRSHPRQHFSPIALTTASGEVLDHGQEPAEDDHGQEPAEDDHDHDGDGKPDHDPEDHDKDEKPKPKPKPGDN